MRNSNERCHNCRCRLRSYNLKWVRLDGRLRAQCQDRPLCRWLYAEKQLRLAAVDYGREDYAKLIDALSYLQWRANEGWYW